RGGGPGQPPYPFQVHADHGRPLLVGRLPGRPAAGDAAGHRHGGVQPAEGLLGEDDGGVERPLVPDVADERQRSGVTAAGGQRGVEVGPGGQGVGQRRIVGTAVEQDEPPAGRRQPPGGGGADAPGGAGHQRHPPVGRRGADTGGRPGLPAGGGRRHGAQRRQASTAATRSALRSSRIRRPSAAEAPRGSPRTPLRDTAATPRRRSSPMTAASGRTSPASAARSRTAPGARASSSDVSVRPAWASPPAIRGDQASTARPSARNRATAAASGSALPP